VEIASLGETMELRHYFHIVKKRAWIPLFLVLVVAIVGVLQGSPHPLYSASMRFVVGLRPEGRTGDYYSYDSYYPWRTAEYLIDDLSEVVKSKAFAEAVRETLLEKESQNDALTSLPAATIQAATTSSTLHRILTVSITWPDAEQLSAIGGAAAAVLQHGMSSFFASSDTDSVELRLIDPPMVSLVSPSLTQRLQLPIRLFLALVAGVALAFLLDYLDDTVRDKGEIESLGVQVLGEIPAPHRTIRLSSRSRTP
jgi:capsular polysaccharide biosynthesis protein